MRWLASLLVCLPIAAADADELHVLPAVHVAYLQYCGGCHGIQGVSAPKTIPTLKDEAGRFLCTPQGRDYLVRLPNIARAPLSDELLTDLLNFVVFSLGGQSVPSGAPHFAVTEVARLRQWPITNQLDVVRQRILSDVQRSCPLRQAGS